MDPARVYARVAARLPDSIEIDGERLTHEVLVALAHRLRPDEAAELGAELPDELADILGRANGDGRLDRDELIEDIAVRLDLDDEDAETALLVVLRVIRRTLEPLVTFDQILESLPPDLAQLMQ